MGYIYNGYYYEWDRNNRKKVYGGKYRIGDRNTGYYGNNDAGDKQQFEPKTYGDEREFKGSLMKNYPFYNQLKGPRTIVARSYEEALRQAKILGYSAADYKRRKRGK